MTVFERSTLRPRGASVMVGGPRRREARERAAAEARHRPIHPARPRSCAPQAHPNGLSALEAIDPALVEAAMAIDSRLDTFR